MSLTAPAYRPIATLCACTCLAFAQDITGSGTVTGFVKGSGGTPASGVRICAVGTPRCATTSDSGGYRLPELRSGSYQLEITVPAQQAFRSSTVEVRAGVETTVDIELPQLAASQQTLTVSETVYVAPEEVKNSGYLIPGKEVWSLAGANQDVSRYVQTLPGVALGSDDFRNDIIVRGGSPLENLFIIDNIEIPNINNFANFASAGGTNSLLDAQLIQDVTFLSGGYPAPFVNRTSSVLQITQKEGDRQRLGGRLTLGSGGLGGILEGPVNKGKGSWIASFRRSFLDAFTDDVGFGGVPITYTFNGKVLYDLTSRDRIWAANITGVDDIRLGLNDENRGKEEISTLDIRYRGWRSATGFNWQHLFGVRAVGLLGITTSQARVNQQVRDLVRITPPPPPGTSNEDLIAMAPVIFKDKSGENETTFKYDLTLFAGRAGKIQTGANFKIFRLNYLVQSPFGSDVPFSPVPDVNPLDLQRKFRAYQNSAYFQSTMDVAKRLNITWGGRFDNYQYLGATRFSPRAGLSYRLSQKLAWKLSYGQYFQQPFFLFVSAFPQNRGLIPWRAEHFVTGFHYTASPTLRITLEAYQKNYRDYPVALQFASVSLANVGDTFAVSDLLFPLASAGRGRVRGIELFLEKKFTNKWFGQANLAFSQARQAGLDGIRRPASFDYPVIANFTGGYRFNSKWEAGLRVSYLDGRPYTPFDEKTSLAQRRGVFDLTRIAELRALDYFRVDFRVDRSFIVRDKPLIVFAGIQNLTNRKNFSSYLWNRATNRPEINEQLGLFPIIGLDWRF
ncbi:MAG: TonB-dependent receptor [Acidobacteria bacterium]|nr:TonB-dependent receptor [Acidobacteriota bacterium]